MVGFCQEIMLRDQTERYRTLTQRLAGPIVLLSFLFVVIMALVLQRVTSLLYRDPQAAIGLEEIQLFVLALAVLWPLFLFEAVVQILALEKEQCGPRQFRHGLLISLCPPLRMAARCPAMGDRIWLPVLGWQEPGRALKRRLEQAFSLPMILIALMILPVLVIEYAWSERVLAEPWLGMLLGLATAVIWLAFTVEFILMCSLAESKLAYCREHWIDLAIILLPLISMLRLARVLRLGRLARLQQLTAASRVYRLRGLAMRAYRALIVLDVLGRITRRALERRLERLRAELAAKEAETQELRHQIALLETRLAEQAERSEAHQGGSR